MELIDKSVYRIKNRFFSSNTYLLKTEENNECLIIDPGLDTSKISDLINKHSLKPIAVLATHGHFDHIGSTSYFKNKFNIPYYLHEADFKMSQSANFYIKLTGLNHKIDSPIPDFYFRGLNENLIINNFLLNIYNFPGHSSGSCIIKYKNYLFSGDTIYKTGLGLDTIPRENKTLLRKSIIKMFDLFDDNHIILPGHGGSASLGIIKATNSDLAKFLLDE